MHSTTYRAVLAASQNWIEHFNRQDLDYCCNAYVEDATMTVYPHGHYETRPAIRDFWQHFMETAHPSDLQYRNVQIRIQSEREAVLSATWSMNVGSGFISKERWVKQGDGVWRLVEDDFSIVTQYEAPRTLTDPQNTALVIVDLQNDYFEGGKMPLYRTEQAAQNTTALLTHFRKTGQPIIHVQHIFDSDDAPFFRPNSPGVDIYPGVKPQMGEDVIVKHSVNSFKETTLDQLLEAKGIKHLVITGAMVQMCIDAVVRHASDAGYQCTIIHDACAAPDITWGGQGVSAEHVKAVMMSAFEFAYGRVSDTQTWLSEQAGLLLVSNLTANGQ